MKRKKNGFGDYPVMGYVRIGSLPTPHTGAVDTFTRYSVLPRDIADASGARPLHRTGTLVIANRKIRGELRRVRMSSLDGKCAGETTAFVPSEAWGKGVIFGAEFLQDTGMHVNHQGEAYCPVKRSKKRR
jgi:hypothetical protein